MFASKAGAYPSEAPFESAPGLTHKHCTRLERLVRVKHSSLLQKFKVGYRGVQQRGVGRRGVRLCGEKIEYHIFGIFIIYRGHY